MEADDPESPDESPADHLEPVKIAASREVMSILRAGLTHIHECQRLGGSDRSPGLFTGRTARGSWLSFASLNLPLDAYS